MPRPENLRSMLSRGDSPLDMVPYKGGAGAGRGGVGEHEGGKKSSKVRPSAPVKATLRELRLRSAASPVVTQRWLGVALWVRAWAGIDCIDEHDFASSSSSSSGRMSRDVPRVGVTWSAALLCAFERRFRLGRMRLPANTANHIISKPHSYLCMSPRTGSHRERRKK